MTYQVKARRLFVEVYDQAGVINRGLEILGAYGASGSDRDRAEDAADRAEAAAAQVESVSFPEEEYFTAVSGQSFYPIDNALMSRTVIVELNGVKQLQGIHYEIATVSGQLGIRFLIDLPITGDLVSYAASRGANYDPNLNRGEFFDSLLELETHIGLNGAVPGHAYVVTDQTWEGVTGADDIEDLPGLVRVGASARPYDLRGSAYTSLPAPGTDEWLFTEFPADGLAGHAITVHGAGSMPNHDATTGAAPDISRVSSFGAANLTKLEEGSRLDAFGTSVFRFAKFAERNTGMGSLVMQWGGSNPTDDDTGHFYNHDILYNAGTPISDPAWDYIGLETDNPGIRATIEAWADAEPWATVSTDFERNVGFGRDALTELIVGSNNAATAYRALSRVLEGSFNTANGADAGGRLLFGDGNTFQGFGAGGKLQVGDNNVILGREGLADFITGDRNVVLGYRGGWGCIGSDNNIYIGPFAGSQDAGGGHASRLYIQPGATGYLVGDMATGRMVLKAGAAWADLPAFEGFSTPRIWNKLLPVSPDMFGPVSTDAERHTALTLALTSGAKYVRLGAGDFRIGNTVTIPGTVHDLAFVMDEDARLIRASNNSILSFSTSPTTHLAYDGSRNIVIEGGTLNGNSAEFFDPGNMIFAQGVDGLRVEGTRFIDTPGLHGLDLNNCRHVRIRACRFEGTSRALATAFIDAGYMPEAIQISHARNPSGATIGCDDVRIENCYIGPGDFDGWPSGVGDHKATNDCWSTNVVVTGCTIEGCEYASASFRKFRDVTFENNHCTGGENGFALVMVRSGTTGAENGDDTASGQNQGCDRITIRGNTFLDHTAYSVAISGSDFTTATGQTKHTDVSILNNHCEVASPNSGDAMIRGNWVSGLKVIGNRMKGGTRGFRGRFCDNFIVAENIVSDTTLEGFYVTEDTETDFVATGLTTKGEFAHNHVERCPYNGILVAGNMAGIHSRDNTFKDVATLTNNTRYCVSYSSSANNARIEGNHCVAGTATNKNKNVVNVTSTCSNIHVEGNSGYFLTEALDIRATGVSHVRQAGAGSPEGVIYAPPGSVWSRTDGGVGTSEYVKQTAASLNTGWVALDDVTGKFIERASTSVRSAVTGTTTRTLLYSTTVPGGCMGPNGRGHLRLLTSQTNNANAKTIEVILGGVAIVNHAPGVTSAGSTSRDTVFMNRSSESAQIVYAANAVDDPGKTTATNSTLAINTAATMTLEVWGTLTNTGDELALEFLALDLLYKA